MNPKAIVILVFFQLIASTVESSAAPVVAPDFTSAHLAVGLSRTTPAFSWFSVDALGRGAGLSNTVCVDRLSTSQSCTLRTDGPGHYRYVRSTPAGQETEMWRVDIGSTEISLRTSYTPDAAAPPFTLIIDQKLNHATLLGLPAGAKRVRLPAVLHLPDRGTFQVSANIPELALENDARRNDGGNFVLVAFPPADRERPEIDYTLRVTAIHPDLPGLDQNALYDGYRRNFINLLQYNPRLCTLANNSSSDVCGLCFWEYAELASRTPPLAPGLTALDLVRMSLDRVLDGGLTYGQTGYGPTSTYPDAAPWSSPYDSLDTLPSFVIAGSTCILGGGDRGWADRRFSQLVAWARQMLAHDRDGDGLIEYPFSGDAGSWNGHTRPANWWDTIGFGHEDAYSNALAYRACLLLSKASAALDRKAEAAEFARAAAKIRASYYRTFYNPATGVLAGWRSKDGRRHDYWFTFINGMAISFGLVDDANANAIMDHLLEKIHGVGFSRFDLGLPGNLVPIRREDYTISDKRYGAPEKADGSDGFQIYENGAATHCHVYWTIKALYRLGRVADARRIFHPLLQSFAEGGFQGFGPNGQSKDWRSWDGRCSGYEGFLADGYLALLAVEDDLRAGNPHGQQK